MLIKAGEIFNKPKDKTGEDSEAENIFPMVTSRGNCILIPLPLLIVPIKYGGVMQNGNICN